MVHNIFRNQRLIFLEKQTHFRHHGKIEQKNLYDRKMTLVVLYSYTGIGGGGGGFIHG